MKNFYISSISGELVEFDKIWASNYIEDVLNENLSIKNYSEVDTLYLIYVAAEQNLKNPTKDSVTYSKRSNMLHMVLNLDYQSFVKANKEEAIEHLTMTYLYGIEKYLSTRKDFNYKDFYSDVERVFATDIFAKNKRSVV